MFVKDKGALSENYVILPLSNSILSGLLKVMLHGDDSQRRFLTQNILAMLEQCCDYSKQCRNNVATLFWAKNRRCESYGVTAPLNITLIYKCDVINKTSRDR